MRTLILALTLSAVAVGQTSTPGYPPGYPGTSVSSQTTMSCGNGVTIRADGSVMVDEWRFYDQTSTPSQKFYPSSVTLGKSIRDSANLCVEFNNGTICADVGKLRALIEQNFPAATSGTKPVKK